MKRQKGFTFVEMMVAVTLSLALGAAVVSVFVGAHNAYQSTAGIGALADGGRKRIDRQAQAEPGKRQ